MVSAATQQVLQILREQEAISRGLRQSLEEELQLSFALWESTGASSEVVAARRSAVTGALHQDTDASSLTAAVQSAEEAGLSWSGTSVTELLDKLQREEDLEGIWRCLASSLSAQDRVGIAFWIEEATKQGLEVPLEVEEAVKSLRDDEASRLQELEHGAALDRLTTKAFAAKNAEALRHLVEEAQRLQIDASSPLAALAALEGEEPPASAPSSSSTTPPPADPRPSAEKEKGVLDFLYVSSPNGQQHCFGMYELVQGERANDQPLWRQLGGERWLYSDLQGRWSIGGRSAFEKKFACNQGFIVCDRPHQGQAPDNMLGLWVRFDEERRAWCKDEEILVSSVYKEEERRARGEAKPKKQPKARARGRGGRVPAGRGEKAKDFFFPKAPAGQVPPMPPLPPPAVGQMTRAKAVKSLGLQATQRLTVEDLRKAYRQQALRWHPDRPQNHGNEEAAKRRFQEVRQAFEFLQASLQAPPAL